jgi:hypothetical protein
MAITSGLWTLNALSVELGVRYRTLGKKLSDLKPDEVEEQAGRQVRRWRLARVVKHLKATDRTIVDGAKVDERRIEDHKRLMTEHLFPALTGSRYFLGFYVAFLHEDIGLTKPQALRAYQAAVLAFHYAIGEFFAGVDAELAGDPPSGNIEDHELEVQIPSELRKLCEFGPEAYAVKYWPATNGRAAGSPKPTQ